MTDAELDQMLSFADEFVRQEPVSHEQEMTDHYIRALVAEVRRLRGEFSRGYDEGYGAGYDRATGESR